MFEKFKEYKNLVENFHNKKIVAIRSDNGGEYLSNEFKNFLKNNGIHHQLTVPRKPQQNGVAERFSQTIFDSAGCMLINAGLSENFWAEAVITACYTRNRCPTDANNNLSPIEKWKNVNLDYISHIKVFGCRAWALNEKRSSKLSSKGVSCIMVGYDSNAKAYM